MKVGDLVQYVETPASRVNTHMLGLVIDRPCLTSTRRAAKTWQVLWFDMPGKTTREYIANLHVLSEA